MPAFPATDCSATPRTHDCQRIPEQSTSRADRHGTQPRWRLQVDRPFYGSFLKISSDISIKEQDCPGSSRENPRMCFVLPRGTQDLPQRERPRIGK